MTVEGDPSSDLVDRLRRRLARERAARAEAEAIAENATRRLFAADEMKSEFVANVSHELRTPLAAIKGSVETLDADWRELDDDTRVELFALLLRNTDVLRHLVEELLEITRASRASQAEPAWLGEPIGVGEVVAAVVADVGRTVASHRVTVEADPTVAVNADPMAIRRIVTNLLENAAKYSPAGSEIRVLVRADPPSAVIAVEDEGIGIPPEEREKVFERFYRAKSALQLGARGLGIGLSLVRSLVEAVGGSVAIDDGALAGVRVTVRLPLSTG